MRKNGCYNLSHDLGTVIIAIAYALVSLAAVVHILLLVGNEKVIFPSLLRTLFDDVYVCLLQEGFILFLKQRAALLIPWLIFAWISLPLYVIRLGGDAYTGAGFRNILKSVWKLILTAYTIVVVRRRRKEITESSGRSSVEERSGI